MVLPHNAVFVFSIVLYGPAEVWDRSVRLHTFSGWALSSHMPSKCLDHCFGYCITHVTAVLGAFCICIHICL